MSDSLSELIASVRSRTDTVVNQVVTDAEITRFLNDGCAELWDLLTSTNEDYAISTATSTLSGSNALTGNNFFTIPSDFYKLRGVDRQVGGAWMTLQPQSMQQRNAFSYFPLINAAFGLVGAWYMLRGDRIYITPVQSADGTYQIHYTPRYAKLVSGGDTLPPNSDVNGWSIFAVAHASAMVQTKQDLDASVFLGEKQAQQQRIINAALPRDDGPPKRMVDTRSSHNYGYSYGGGGGSGII